MSVLAISFVHPAILGGLALASLPIIIHILNRRRFKTMEWAAMEFLLKAAVRNRRRVRLENLLLLALRTLLVLCLIVAVARPFSKRDDALASLFGSEGATERVILLDDSHSMHAGQGNKAAFKTAQELIKRLVKRLHDEKSSDRVTLVRGSRPREGGEGFARVAVASAQYKRMLGAVDGLKVSDSTFDVATVVDAILEGFEEKESRVVLHLVSDFRRRDWSEPDGSLRPDIVKALGRFSERGEVRFLDVGSSPVQNLGIVELRAADRALIAGVPSTFVATIRNHGPDPASDFSYWFEFGKNVPPTKRFEGTLQPGEEAEVKAEFTFRGAGPAVVKARIGTDVVPGDDTRRRVVNVRRAMRFLLVDGEPEHEDFRSETDFVAAALMPPGRSRSGIEVDVVTEHTFSGGELEVYDGIFLCNVYRLPDDRVEQLEQYVRDGGGLVFFLGDQVDPQVYNSTFFGRGDEAGKKLLPLVLREVEGSDTSYVHFAAPAADHPVIRFLRGINEIIFRTVSIRRYIRGDLPVNAEDARVIMTYTDEDGAPALAEKSFGEGRVLLFTTAADIEWSDFAKSDLFLPILLETAAYIVKPDPDEFTLPVGTPIVIRYDPKVIGPQVAVVPPAELGGAPVTLQSIKADNQLLYRFERTLVAGTYAARLKTRDGEPFERPYVFNVAPGEGDLRRADLVRVAEAVPGARIERAGDESAFDTEDSDRTEFWRTLIYVLIAVAALETVLAWRFGHHATRKLTKEEGKQVFVR